MDFQEPAPPRNGKEPTACSLWDRPENGATFLPSEPGAMIGSSPAMRRLFQQMAALAPYDTTLVLQGKSGTGKELAARLIHRCSPRRNRPFVTVCCTSLCESVLESELFGHEKGAFTSATCRHPGSFERADGGTLFLDEIGAASPLLQQRLLRVLQERAFERVGGCQSVAVDIRLIAATNLDLLQAVADRRFREDLYYRLNGVTLEISPLRERREDIPELAAHFLRVYGEKFGKQGFWLSERTMEVMMAYDWPGNVRELQHALERAVLLARSPCIGPEHMELRKPPPAATTHPVNPCSPLHEAMAGFERFFLESALHRHRGNVTLTARQLGISRKTLYDRMEHCDIDPECYREQ